MDEYETSATSAHNKVKEYTERIEYLRHGMQGPLCFPVGRIISSMHFGRPPHGFCYLLKGDTVSQYAPSSRGYSFSLAMSNVPYTRDVRAAALN